MNKHIRHTEQMKKNSSEINFFDVINLIIRFKKIIGIIIFLSIIFGFYLSLTKKNIYRSEIPIKFKFNISNVQFDINYSTDLLRKSLLNNTSPKLYATKFSELENMNTPEIFSKNPIDIIYKDTVLRIIVDTPYLLSEKSIQNVIYSINYSINKRNEYLLEIYDINYDKTKNQSNLNHEITEKLLNYEVLMDKEIYMLEKRYKLVSDYKISEAELSSYSSLPRKKLLFITQKFSNLLAKISSENKVSKIEYNEILSNFSKIQNNYEKYINIQEKFYGIYILPEIESTNEYFITKNKLIPKSIIAYTIAFILIGFILSLLSCLIYSFILKNKNKININ